MIERSWLPEGLSTAARVAAVGGFAGVCGLVAARVDAPANAPLFIFQTSLGLLLSVIDVRTRRLPDALTLPAYPVTAALLAIAAVGGGLPRSLIRAAASALLVYAIYFAISWWSDDRGIGRGDAKFAGLLAASLGWLGTDSVLLGLLFAHLLATLTIAALIVLRQPWRGRTVAFGPYLFAGWYAAVMITA